jgi:hypothetical protein
MMLENYVCIDKKIPTPKNHCCAKVFSRAVSTGIFEWRSETLYNQLRAHLVEQGRNPDEVLLNDPDYFLKSCPRTIPPPNIVH